MKKLLTLIVATLTAAPHVDSATADDLRRALDEATKDKPAPASKPEKPAKAAK